MNITEDKWDELSDKLVNITRKFNGMYEWDSYSTSYWRNLSDDALSEILKLLDIEVENG